MPEEDTLWRSDQHESKEHCVQRVKSVLDEVWARDDTYVSLTAHADIMRACFKGNDPSRGPDSLPPRASSAGHDQADSIGGFGFGLKPSSCSHWPSNLPDRPWPADTARRASDQVTRLNTGTRMGARPFRPRRKRASSVQHAWRHLVRQASTGCRGRLGPAQRFSPARRSASLDPPVLPRVRRVVRGPCIPKKGSFAVMMRG